MGEQKPPRDSRGQIMAKKCLDCGGELFFERGWEEAGRWCCDELLDVGEYLPLEACEFYLLAGVNDEY